MSDDTALDWLTLDGDEEVLWTSHPHRLSLLPALVIGVPLSVVLIGIPIVVGAYLNYVNTDHVVTTSGVYKKTGVLSRDVGKIGFEKVQNISYTQSALGANVGYGTVEISTAGGSGVEMTFRSVPDPAEVHCSTTYRWEAGRGFAAGTFATPAAEGEVRVTGVGFEPDLLVLTVSAGVGGDGDAVEGFRGFTHGKVARRPAPAGADAETVLGQNALSLGAGAGDDRVTGRATDGYALDVVLRDAGGVGRVRGVVTDTHGDGFTVSFDEVDAADLAGEYEDLTVGYQAFSVPDNAAVEVGRFTTAASTGGDSVDIGVDADLCLLTATNVVGSVGGDRTTDGAAGFSHGVAVGDQSETPAQWAMGSVVAPGSDAHGYTGADDRALDLRYLSAGSVAGRTSATVSGLGEDGSGTTIDLNYDSVHDDGSGAGRVVTYVAVDTAGEDRPDVGHFETPETAGETVEVTTGFRPAAVSFVGAGSVPGAPGDASLSAAGSATDTAPLSHGAAAGLNDQTVLGEAAGSTGTATATRNAVELVFLDEDGAVAGRDVGRVSGLTETGFEVRFPEVATGEAAAHDAAAVCYVAWPAVPETVEYEHERTVALADLGLSPLDALYLSQPDDRGGQSQLEERVRYHMLRTRPDHRPPVPDDAAVELAFGEAGGGRFSVGEFLEVARSVRELVLDGREVTAEDLGHPDEVAGPGYPEDTVLTDRANAAQDEFASIAGTIDNRRRLLDPPDGGPNLPSKVDDIDAALADFRAEVPIEEVGRVPKLVDGPTVSDQLEDLQQSLRGRWEPDPDPVDLVVEAADNYTVTGTVGGYEEADVAVGKLSTPASAGTVEVDDIGFEPDLLVFTVSNTVGSFGGSQSREFDRLNGSYGWSHGKARCYDDGRVVQNCLAVASDSHSTNSATGESSSGEAVVIPIHDDGKAGEVRGTVTGTSPHGNGSFEVEFTTVDTATATHSLTRDIDVTYRAFDLPAGTDATVGHFRTPQTPGTEHVDLGVDANHVSLTATNLVDGPDQIRTTDLTAGISHGDVVGRESPDQQVLADAREPSNINWHSYAADDNRALHILYQSGDAIDGRTTARVRSLGESMAVEFDEVYRGAVPGKTPQRLVTYVAMDCGETLKPDIGSFRTPKRTAETVEAETGFEVGLLELTASATVPEMGVESVAENTPFGLAHGATEYDYNRYGVYQSHSVHSESTNRHAAKRGWGTGLVYPDREGRITDRMETRTSASTPDGFEVEFDELASPGGGSTAAFERTLVLYKAWPREDVPDHGVVWKPTMDFVVVSRDDDAAHVTQTPDVTADADGNFSVDLDFGTLDEGDRFRVIGTDDGDVLFSATGRVGSPDDPEPSGPAPVEQLADLPAVRRLLWLDRAVDRTDPQGEGPGRALADALDLDGGWTAIDDEATLMDEIRSETAVTGADVDTVAALADLKGVDLSGLTRAGEAALAPVERTGVTELFDVAGSLDEPGSQRFWLNGSADLQEVHERLWNVRRAGWRLGTDYPGGLLAFPEPFASYAAKVSGPVAFARGLDAFLDQPGWLTTYLGHFLEDAGTFVTRLQQLLYVPRSFVNVTGFDESDPSRRSGLREFRAEIDRLEAGAGGMRRLEELFRDLSAPASETRRERFARQLKAFTDQYMGSYLSAVTGSRSRPEFDSEYRTDLDSLETTVDTQQSLMDAAGTAGDLSSAYRRGVLESLRAALFRASYYGVYGTVPRSVAGATPEDEATLAEQAGAVGDELRSRLAGARANDPRPGAPGGVTTPTVENQRERLQALFGEDFAVLAPFEPANRPELSLTVRESHQSELLSAGDSFAPESLLQRIARIRERPALFREATSYAEMVTDDMVRDLRVGQLPYREDDDWVGLGTEDGPGAGTLSLLVQFASEHDPAAGVPVAPRGSPENGPIAGLFVDEWVEQVPDAEETTGVALNYDDPNARAPQSVLLAAPPASGEWSREALVETVRETMDLAKLRGVDLDVLDAADSVTDEDDELGLLEHLGLLVPALWFPYNTRDDRQQPETPSVQLETFDWYLREVVDFEASMEIDLGGSEDGGGEE